MKKLIIIFFASVLLFGCTKNNGNSGFTGEGYKPVYISKDEAFTIQAKSPTDLISPGKMYLYNNEIYITDKGLGVHIINNANPAVPKKVKFISIPGVKDVVVKNGVLYADNMTDLIALDISDLSNITLKKRIKDIYPIEDQFYPETVGGYFECVDPSKGYVLRWEKTQIVNAKCYR
ncbi:MAG: hypothetical protein K9J13_16285 [Saprospiraceae bacterium]|nr:hypothetical protein [Saprospiraceae bacterium]